MHRTSTIYWQRLEGHQRLNGAIVREFDAHKNHASSRCTHFFAGRYENIYVERNLIPAVDELLEAARTLAAEILDLPGANLTVGFWFNEMLPGHVTLRHSHDDLDELLSATYYLRVPQGSGELLILDGLARTRIKPLEGLLVFFDPELMHEVTENRSQKTRLSIGMNFGLRSQTSGATKP